MKNRVRIIGLISLMLVLALTTACKKEEPKEDIISTAVEENHTVEAFGLVKAKEVKNITIDFSAFVEAIPVKEGQQVALGETLAILNIQDFNTEIKVKEHELNILKLQREKIKNNIFEDDREDPAIKLLLNDLNHAEETYLRARQDFLAQETLFKEGAISKTELEASEADMKAKTKAVDDARIALELKSRTKKEGLDELKIQGEKISMQENELDAMKAKLNYSYLRDNQVISDMVRGIVYDIGFAAGDGVSIERKLLSLMSLDSLAVEADIPEEFIKDVKIGAEAVIIPVADKGREYRGKIIRIANQAIQKNGETIIPIEIELDENDEFLRPNYNVDISILIK